MSFNEIVMLELLNELHNHDKIIDVSSILHNIWNSVGQVTIDLFFHKKWYLMWRNHLDVAQGIYFTYMIPLLTPFYLSIRFPNLCLALASYTHPNIQIIALLNIQYINDQLIIQIVSSHMLVSCNLPIIMSLWPYPAGISWHHFVRSWSSIMFIAFTSN